MKHIFEPFFTTKADKGTGLGLATAYGIVKKAGGYVWAYSEVGQGTIFKIYFPALDSSSAKPNPESASTTNSVHKVLVVDDDNELRAVTVQGLAQRGFLVSEARGGAEALHQLRNANENFDILLTDLIMPAMNGHQLCEAALLAQPSLRVVLMSGYEGSDSNGASGSHIPLIEKPFNLDSVAARLRALLAPNGNAKL
jgi:CheY-like chemotaxis protein